MSCEYVEHNTIKWIISKKLFKLILEKK